MTDLKVLDCTLRDGGYYNAWNFDRELVGEYLEAMSAAGVDIVELGQRFITNSGFKGPHAFTTDDFLRTLDVPDNLSIAVMVNGADLLREASVEQALEKLFPETAQTSPVEVVRIACHLREMEQALAAAQWLKDRGFRVGFNLMQIADRSHEEVVQVAQLAARHPVDVLYFADSMGSMDPHQTAEIISWLREGWQGPIGIHTHDNMGIALQNTLRAKSEGALWLDATVTGMGRGPGNARTEELVIALDGEDGRKANLVPLLSVIRKHFQPMKNAYRWGTNPFYFLSGKHGIHPTYIQEMDGDARYGEEDILAVIDYLREEGGKKYSADSLAAAKTFFSGEPRGSWTPAEMMEGREVLLVGNGPGAVQHREAIERYVRNHKPVVIGLNTDATLDPELIDLRAACHPVRLLADAGHYRKLPQKVAMPYAMLPEALRDSLDESNILDFGVSVERDAFRFDDTSCVVPAALVASYALAMIASGKATRVLLAGFDGYDRGDPRNDDLEAIFAQYQETDGTPPLVAVTPTAYPVPEKSIYGM